MLVSISIVVLFLFTNKFYCEEIDDSLIDKNGYIVYCPCMGKLIV